VNRESGAGAKYFIEEQRYCGDLVQTGLATGDASIVATGLKALEWGLSRQGSDGSFPGTGDPFHSTALFLEGASRALLSLSETGDPKYDPQIAKLTPRLLATARWLEQPNVERTGQAHNAPYTHRRWILAAALAQTAMLAHAPELFEKAKAYAEQGLALQQGDGVDPEKGGYDVSYQAVGILEAEKYFAACQDAREQAKVQEMIERAANWEISMIGPDGQVNIGDSTRVEAEAARSGKIKHVNTKELLQALAYATTITGEQKYLNKAALVARARGWY
jgi:hypothetical protein